MITKTYSIKAVARLIGVPVETLRNWERRYYFLNPERNQRGVRVYSDADVELLKTIVCKTLAGERVGDIAERIRKGELLLSEKPEPPRLSNDIQSLIEEFYQALLQANFSKIEHLHENLKVSLSFTQMLEFVYSPIKERVNLDCEAGKVGPAEAGFCRAFVRQIVFGFLASAKEGSGERRKIVCATLPGDFDEVSLMLISAHLKYRGWGVYYLGCGVTPSEVNRFSRRAGAMIYISVSESEVLDRELLRLQEIRRPVFLGGEAVQARIPEEIVEGDLHFIGSSGASAAEAVARFAESYR